MLLSKLPGVLAVEGPLPVEHRLIYAGQAVCVRALGNLAADRLGSGVERRRPAEQPRRAGTLQMFDESEVGDLDAIADEEEVARLDVEMLQTVLLAHEVEG